MNVVTIRTTAAVLANKGYLPQAEDNIVNTHSLRDQPFWTPEVGQNVNDMRRTQSQADRVVKAAEG